MRFGINCTPTIETNVWQIKSLCDYSCKNVMEIVQPNENLNIYGLCNVLHWVPVFTVEIPSSV